MSDQEEITAANVRFLGQDVIEIYGVPYAASLFRTLASDPVGGMFEVVSRRGDGVVWLQDIGQEVRELRAKRQA